MLKKHILPALAGIAAFVVAYGAIGYLLAPVDLDNSLKGLLIIIGSVIVGVIVNNFLSNLAREQES